MSLIWFSRIPNASLTAPLLERTGGCKRTCTCLLHSTACTCQAQAPAASSKNLAVASNLRQNFIYATPGTMSEDFRSRMKFLTSKNHPAPPGAPDPLEHPDSLREDGGQSMTSSVVSLRSARSMTDAMSVTATRNSTARQYVRPMAEQLEGKAASADNAKRVACPKPNAASPYAKNDDGIAAPNTLKNHYAKVLLQPFKPFGVTFPTAVAKEPADLTKKKPPRFDQYLGGRGQHAVAAGSAPVIASQNRHLQSNSGDCIASDAVRPVDAEVDNNYQYVRKKANDSRYLEMCTASDDKVYVPPDAAHLRKKHVETVKMEVIKLDRKLKRTKGDTNINRELEHVLQEALAQSKVYEHNVLGAYATEDLDDGEDEHDLHPRCCWTAHGYRSLASRFQPTSRTPRFANAMLEKEARQAPAKVSFDAQTRSRVRARSEDGKHCYNVLKTNDDMECPPQDCDAVAGGKPAKAPSSASVNEAVASEDVANALTDLNNYDDGGSSKAITQMVSSGYKNVAAQAKHEARQAEGQARLTKLERDIKMAQRQHNQRVLDVFEIMKGVKKS